MSDLMALSNFSLPINFISNAAAMAMVEPSCVCSPLSYTFTIDLNQNCETDTFTDNPGISDTVCRDLPGIGLAAESADTLIVYDIQFLEVDTSGNLIVINQDDTYNNVSLSTGDTITFESASANLNPDEPLSSQLNYVPGGVLMKLVAKNEGSDTIVRQQVSWLYTNSCDDLPTSVGDAIGWITLTDQTEASSAFCPVTATEPPTTSPTQSPTAAPVASTDPPTSSPTKEPTPSPVAATNPPTSSPTQSPTPAPVASTDPPTSSPTKEPASPCACAPSSYTFTLDLRQDCETDTLEGAPGIGLTFCFLGSHSLTLDPSVEDLESDLAQNADIEITSVHFLEFDTSGELNVINQDDTYSNVSLTTGDTVTFDSISADLDPAVPLSDQLEYLPGGVHLTLRGRFMIEGSEKIVSNRITWSYSNACNSLPLSVGDAIGWVALTGQTEASQAFCPVATSTMPTPSPTKTATVSPTTSPVAVTKPPTTSPTQSPTPAPVASTDPPTSSPTKGPTPSPVAVTDPPTTSSMSISLSTFMGKGNKRQKEKTPSSKSKSNKASKAATKAQKISSKATSSTSLSVLI